MSGETESGPSPTPLERARDIDAWCDRFEAAWNAGHRPRVEDFLADAPAAFRADLEPELLSLHAALRRAVVERTPADVPRDRTPAVDPVAALDPGSAGHGGVPSAADSERRAVADQVVGERLEWPFTAHRRTLAAGDGVAGEPDPSATGRPTDADGGGERAGGVIAGRYRLLEELGQGGMGTVWAAEQTEPVRRVVALKLIRPGMDTRDVLARFEAERQTLALMDHPNIARVLDGGAAGNGRPFFAMEYVRGAPITRFCDGAGLGIAERLKLFATVCLAVQHAHQKGIIHRDLKPSNILVGPVDGRPVPKVIDFGLAKVVREPLTGQTLHTAHGTLMGTPLYMSPEQAGFRGHDVDTRADVYALGVVLFELLTGTTPLGRPRPGRDGFDEVLRRIREEDPPRPSARLGGSSPGAADRLHPDSARLSRLVRGELDWIVMKCLEKDRARRYETADALARDIERYLAEEPVEAGPPGAAYRLRKFARRHRKALAAAGSFALLLVLGTTISVWQAARATAAGREARANERRADEEAAIARAVNAFLLDDLLGQADIGNQAAELGRDRDVKARELLDRAARVVEARFRGQELTEAAVRLTLGQAYRALGEYAEAQGHLERAVQLRERRLGAEHAETLASMRALAVLLADRRRDEESERLYRRVLEARRARLGARHPHTLQSLNDLGALACDRGRPDQAEPLLLQALEGRRAALGDGHPDTFETMNNIGSLHHTRNRFAQAESWYRRARDGWRATLGADHPRTLEAASNLALALRDLGRLEEAEDLYDEILAIDRAKLGSEHPWTLQASGNLAAVYWDRGRRAEAIELAKQVAEATRRRLGPDHAATVRALSALGVFCSMSNRLDDAEPILVEVLAIQRRTLGAGHEETIVTLSNLGAHYSMRGRLGEAEALLGEALAGARKAFGMGDTAVTQQVVNHLALVHSRLGKPQLSEPNLREVLAALRERHDRDSDAYGGALGALSNNLIGQENYADAEPILRESLEIAERKIPDHWRTSVIRASLGAAFRKQGKYLEAEPLLLRGYEGLRASADRIPPQSRHNIAETVRSIVALYESWARPGEAAAWRAKLGTDPATAAVLDADFPADPFASP
ncbi:serine/threonine-protein kinase [Paludisphaera mucosa]|uniref:Serine/threonine-protein kinase n=1 Tax=Paludisphaera mucosa TaxID=3030827 RepID=A0ABT6F4X5_9BACT|nr:serine/threonine-protein kinase [Paludisphaera mucosa]MDG3002604.1 serine/threonine-protein kinase [Paludisphaera mucosa]